MGGCYADGHVVVQRLTCKQLRDGEPLRDTEIVEESVRSYASHGAVLSLSKRFDIVNPLSLGELRSVAAVA